MAKDMVNHPDHYTSTKYEVIDIIEAFTDGLVGIEATDTGNILKYMCRWKHKNGLEDLKKARWYLNHLIDKVENGVELDLEDETMDYITTFEGEVKGVECLVFDCRSKAVSFANLLNHYIVNNDGMAYSEYRLMCGFKNTMSEDSLYEWRSGTRFNPYYYGTCKWSVVPGIKPELYSIN